MAGRQSITGNLISYSQLLRDKAVSNSFSAKTPEFKPAIVLDCGLVREVGLYLQ